jgi:HPt (histidine-containing phosphotransfer) domain-containing protein
MEIAALAKELGLEEADVRRLVLTFLETTELDLAGLEEAFADGDVEQLRQRAHHIKGAAGNLEFDTVVAAALAVEETARAGILADPSPQIDSIRRELKSIRAQMKEGD